MLTPFFLLAAKSPTRQQGFRRAVVGHLVVLGGVVWQMYQNREQAGILLGNMLLVAGIVEGAVLVGWRLTQLPKSQALEFVLVSPLRPAQFLFGEAVVGLTQLALVTLAGLPVLGLLASAGLIEPLDIVPLLVMPFTWGAATGLGLTVWAYEPELVRLWGERFTLGLVLVYLIVGVLAGENLKNWLDTLPPGVARGVLQGFAVFHTHNPFGVMRFWFEHGSAAMWERALALEAAGVALVLGLLGRASWRLQPHFHERHYQPAKDVSGAERTTVGDQPLTWWAVKRVSEYSGRINLWLAGGFGVLYALYMVAGAAWPAWMGQRVFQICDLGGGVALLTTGLVLLAAVPAAFQYGLWDSNAQDRCRRLELLLLTRLTAHDYWRAAAAAAWSRGKGYFFVAALLWAAGCASGRMTFVQATGGAAAGVLLWACYFALGFRAFARGAQANGLGMMLTVGLPLAVYGLVRLGLPLVADLLPPGSVFSAGSTAGSTPWLAGPLACAFVTLTVAQRSLLTCDADLRRWYDRHHGSKVMG